MLNEDIMLNAYRAPEVSIEDECRDWRVDIWNAAVLVRHSFRSPESLLRAAGGGMIQGVGHRLQALINGHNTAAYLMIEFMSLSFVVFLGPPPPEFQQRNEKDLFSLLG